MFMDLSGANHFTQETPEQAVAGKIWDIAETTPLEKYEGWKATLIKSILEADPGLQDWLTRFSPPSPT